jgi:tetratricopeptide (TPR) repeat protein
MAVLTPSLLMVALPCSGGGLGRRLFRAGLALGVAAGVGGLLLIATGTGVGNALQGLGPEALLPWLGEPTSRQAYRVVSPLHALDLANALLLACPAAVGLTLISRSSGLTRPGLLPAGVVAVLLSGGAFVSNPAIGAFRDWDALSLPALPLTVVAALAAFDGQRRRNDGRAVALLLLVCLLHTGGWAAVNSDAAAMERRYADLLERESLSQHGRAYGWEVLGSVRSKAERHSEAQVAWERAAALVPGHQRYWYNAGCAALESADYSSARRHLDRAIGLSPDYVDAFVARAQVGLRQGDVQAAIEDYRAALRIHPRRVDVALSMARLASSQGASEVTLQACNLVLAVHPGQWEASLGAALTELALGRPREALTFLRAISAKDSAGAALPYATGNSQMALREWGSAAAAYREAVRIDPGLRDAHYNLGLALLQLRDTVNAVASFRSVLRIDAQDPHAARMLQWLNPSGGSD